MPISKSVISELEALVADEVSMPDEDKQLVESTTPATDQALVKATSPLEGEAPSPLEGEAPSPLEGEATSPLEGEATSPGTGVSASRFESIIESVFNKAPTVSVSPGAPPPGTAIEDIQAREQQFQAEFKRPGIPLKTDKEIGPELPTEGFSGYLDKFWSAFETSPGAFPAGAITGKPETSKLRVRTVSPATLRMQLGTLPSAKAKAKALTSFVRAQDLDPADHPVRVADMGRVIVPFKNPQGEIEDILLDSPALNATDLQDLASDALTMLGSGAAVKLGSAAFPKLVSFAPKGAQAFAGTIAASGTGTAATRMGLLAKAREATDLEADWRADVMQSLAEAGVEAVGTAGLTGLAKLLKVTTSPIQASTAYFKRIPGYEKRLNRLRESMDNLSNQLGIPVEELMSVGELTNDPRLLSVERYVSDQGGGGLLAQTLQRARELKYTILDGISAFPSKGLDVEDVNPAETAMTAMWKRLGELDDAADNAKKEVLATATQDALDMLHSNVGKKGLGSKLTDPGTTLRSFVNGVRSSFRKKRDYLYKQVADKIEELSSTSPERIPGITEYDQIVKTDAPRAVLKEIAKPAKIKKIVTRESEAQGIPFEELEADPSRLFDRQAVEMIETEEVEEEVLGSLLEGFHAKYSTIFSKASQGMSIETADLIRKELNDDMGSLLEKPFAKNEQRRLIQLKAALDEELDLAADRIDDPTVRQLMKDANSFYAKNIEKFQTGGIKKLFNLTADGRVRMPDTEVLGQLLKSPADYSALKLFSKDYPKVWAKVQRSMLDKLVADSGVGGTLDLIKFQKKLTSLPEAIRKDMLGTSYEKTLSFLNKVKPKAWADESIYVPKSLFNEWVTWTEMAGRKSKLGPPPTKLQAKIYDAANKSVEATTTFSNKLVKKLREKGGPISIEQIESIFPEDTFVKTLLDKGSDSDIKFVINSLSADERQKLAQLSLEEVFHRSNYAATQRARELGMDVKDSAINGTALSGVLSKQGMGTKLRLLLGKDTYRLLTDFETVLRRGESAREKAGNPGSSLSKGEDIKALVETKLSKLANRARYWTASVLMTSPLFKEQALKPLPTSSPKWDSLSYLFFLGPQFGSAVDAASGDSRAAGINLLSDLIPASELADRMAQFSTESASQ